MESKSFIVIDIKFDKPLIARKPFDVLAYRSSFLIILILNTCFDLMIIFFRVSELIPPRPKYPMRNNSAEKAVSDFHSQIKIIINSVIDDYR